MPHRDPDFSELVNLCPVEFFPLLWPLGDLEFSHKKGGVILKKRFISGVNTERKSMPWLPESCPK